MKICGLTGGVGMGKSTAAGFFLERGACLVDTDVLARQLVLPGQPALAEITREFGNEILAPDGGLDRVRLADIVFHDKAAREKLEGILHPRIRGAWLQQVENWRVEKRPLAMVVIPLLFETRAETYFDSVICVACTPGTQLDRLLKRGWTREEITRRIDAQMPVEQKIAKSDFLIWSEGALEVHQNQVDSVLQRIELAPERVTG
jgi:dephospho-CoA kinase